MNNVFLELEETVWRVLWSASGEQTATLQHDGDTITVRIIPKHPKPDSLPFEDFRLYKTMRIFVVGKAELNGLIPKEGDILTYNNTDYMVKKTPNTPCFEDIGSYGVSIRLYTSVRLEA